MEIYFKRGNLLDRVPFSYLKRCKNIKIKEEENNWGKENDTEGCNGEYQSDAVCSSCGNPLSGIYAS